MYLKTAISRAYYRYILLWRKNANLLPQTQGVNIFTKERALIEDGKRLLPSAGRTTELKGIQTRYDYARRLLVDGVLKRVTNSLASDLRRKCVRQHNNGNPSAFFALVGTSLASGTGVITRNDELEGVCWEIRESIRRMRANLFEAENREFEDEFSLSSLEFGKVIAKGCNAVVYEAREKTKDDNEQMPKEYPLAVKMMFNFDAESNASSILRSMYREMVPLQNVTLDKNTIGFWENEMAERIQRLPPHVNIVAMYRSLTDYVPDLPSGRTLYPDALPMRLNPEGYGRNMSLFLVMKKYNTNLRQYLIDKPPDIRDGILLLTQLLEAVTHMNRCEIAHRDLKSDNILLDTSEGENNCPTLVVTDFGCCLSDRYYGLKMPYRTPDMDRGGNAALMAPEVATAQAGMFSTIDYSKSDIWTVGTLAYEIFTGMNPFYKQITKEQGTVLRNTTYTDDMLPELPAEVPSLISRLVRNMLAKNPAKRLDAETAATICQLYLWAPSQWISKNQLPSSSEILQWLLSLTTKILYEGPILFHKRDSQRKRASVTEYQLIATFLQRVKLKVISKALSWIQEEI
ncbi:serine/threonine-protein kinase Pink1, mitochondrial [Planococcus citri]|uniref:serine/threonine-protein kinase Pink1, mitochondrial n=1 Tax=Planococcus citri TaxID=170843 RepID=UPI0031F73D8F